MTSHDSTGADKTRAHDPAQEISPAETLLPLDAYPKNADAAMRSHIDEHLRQRMTTIPTEVGTHYDSEGHAWVLDENGGWTDHDGKRRSSAYTPIISLFGPFTREARRRG